MTHEVSSNGSLEFSARWFLGSSAANADKHLVVFWEQPASPGTFKRAECNQVFAGRQLGANIDVTSKNTDGHAQVCAEQAMPEPQILIVHTSLLVSTFVA